MKVGGGGGGGGGLLAIRQKGGYLREECLIQT